MNCKLDKNLLYSYEDKTIEPLEKIFVDEHLKYCEECREELDFIKLMDKELVNCKLDIEAPERLSVISELIVENFLAETVGHKRAYGIKEYFKDATIVSKAIVNSSKLSYSNPVNNYIKDKIFKSAKVAVSPINKYYKKKLKEVNIFKILKVG